MLAGTIKTDDQIRYPCACTPKLDGMRCLVSNGKALSRSFKDIPNHHTRVAVSQLPDGFDGELMVPHGTFQDTMSAFMSENGEPDFRYYVFDYFSDLGYTDRMAALCNWHREHGDEFPWVVLVLPTVVATKEDLAAFEERCLSAGYEGVMLRDPNGAYKAGRSTVKQFGLVKLKRMSDSECVVIGFEEMQHNDNVAEVDAFGRSKRSSYQENKRPAGTLGKFLVREIGDTVWKGQKFAIGTGEGLTHALRAEVWANRDAYLGRIITYKYQAIGVKILPRLPIMRGFRDARDMS